MNALVVDFGAPRSCLSSAVLGGGFTKATHWLNLQVARDYSRVDPAVHLAQEARSLGLDPQAVIGMLTAADVTQAQTTRRGVAAAHVTVGIGHPLAAAGRVPRKLPPAGTINTLVLVDAALSAAALVGAVQTATEAKAQALADARVAALNHAGHATGTATDSVCIAALPGSEEAFAGPATSVGAAIAAAVHAAVLSGCCREERREAAR